jgi:hypothetical protein
MTYKTEFPDYTSTIPDIFLAAPWEDASWHNEACPCFSRRIGPVDEDAEVHVYVGETDEHPRDSVRFTNEDGVYPHDAGPLDFSSDSLADVLDRIEFLAGEISR